MKILITGGAGYVGTELAIQLTKLPNVSEVFIYDNFSRLNYNIFTGVNFNSKVKVVKGDILNSHKLESIMRKVDMVYHLAAKVMHNNKFEDSHSFEQVNNWGTAEVAHYAKELSNIKHFVYLSTVAVYGATTKDATIDSIPNPNTHYSKSKLRGEEHVNYLANHKEVYIIRSGNVYGYSPCVRYDSVINKFLLEAHFLNKITIHGDGSQTRPFTNINRLCNVLAAIVDEEQTLNAGIYNCAEVNLSINDIRDTLIEMYPNLEYSYINQHIQLSKCMVEFDNRLSEILNNSDKVQIEDLENFVRNFSN